MSAGLKAGLEVAGRGVAGLVKVGGVVAGQGLSSAPAPVAESGINGSALAAAVEPWASAVVVPARMGSSSAAARGRPGRTMNEVQGSGVVPPPQAECPAAQPLCASIVARGPSADHDSNRANGDGTISSDRRACRPGSSGDNGNCGGFQPRYRHQSGPYSPQCWRPGPHCPGRQRWRPSLFRLQHPALSYQERCQRRNTGGLGGRHSFCSGLTSSGQNGRGLAGQPTPAGGLPAAKQYCRGVPSDALPASAHHSMDCV